jgi:flagellar biosynthesis/type III secretory pathway protein FliH
VEVAAAAVEGVQALDPQTAARYTDSILANVSDIARVYLEALVRSSTPYEFQSSYFKSMIAEVKDELRAEARAQGMVEGKVEGKAEGRTEGLRLALLSWCQRRFPEARSELETLLQACPNPELPGLMEEAFAAADQEALLRAARERLPD